MKRLLAATAAVVLLAGCAEFRSVGSLAIEQRRVANDMQARATMAAVCDLSIGAFYRELTFAERVLAAQVCGGEPLIPNAPRTPLGSRT